MLWLVLVDDLHLDFRNTGHVRNLLKVLSRELIREGDVFTVASSGPSNVSIEPTLDRTRLAAVIARTSGNALHPRDIVDSTASAAKPNEVVYRAGLAVSAAHVMITGVEQVRSRRKALLYVSSGYAFDPPRYGAPETDPRIVRGHATTIEEVRRRFASLTRLARRAPIRVFAIDPGRIPPSASDVPARWNGYLAATRSTLWSLSEQTRGLALLEVQDPAAAARSIADALR